MDSAITTDGVGVRFGRTQALRDCTLSVPSGSFVALVGPNGAGKTTLLHLLAGLRRPTEGTVTVLGSDPSRDAALLPRIGLVAQDAPVYGSFSVAEMLRFGSAMNPGWDHAQAASRIGALGISPRQRCSTLSGGQRAQVALAVAMGKRPEILLLDEPLASLDPLARSEFLDALREVSASGVTVVLSSHLLSDLERVGDHLVLIAEGRVQLAGAIATIIDEHQGSGEPRSLESIVLARLRRPELGRGAA